MLNFFLSIKTYLWVTGISVAAFLAGSLYIPNNLHIFSGINDMPLFKWLSQNSGDMNKFLWIYLLVGLIALLWISTLICSLDAIIRRTTWKGLVRVLSPQILHIAVLLVLLGHGISAVTGYKQDVSMKINETRQVKGFDLQINKMDFFKNPGESSTRWRVHININDKPHVLELGKPSFYNGVGFFVKSAQQKKMKAIIGIIHDPGVLWELIGAVIFVIGAFGIFYVKLREDSRL